jgi:hypothetical protein
MSGDHILQIDQLLLFMIAIQFVLQLVIRFALPGAVIMVIFSATTLAMDLMVLILEITLVCVSSLILDMQ